MDPDLGTELFESLGLGTLLPEPLAAWRPLLAEGMAFFLERLPEARLGAIVAEQIALASSASAAARATAVLAHCPTLHKLGQIVARQPGLDAELRRHLQALESLPASTGVDGLHAHIHAELGADHGLHLADRALAEGSVAVVLPFSWRQGGRSHDGVFKLLKPGIADRLAEELAILPALGDFLEDRGTELGLPAIDYRSHLAAAGRLLVQEIRLDREQANLRAAAVLLADDADVFVPALLPWCTPALTAMERIDGPKLSDAALSVRESRRLGRALVGGLLARPFWSCSEATPFHGDLSQGQRNSIMRDFRAGKTPVLVATDVAARGIDVDNIDLVINYDVPDKPEYYVHRIGRTGRAGHSGFAATLVSDHDIPRLRVIKKQYNVLTN